MQVVRIVAACGILALLGYVVLTPSVYYLPPQRVLMYLLAAVLVGLLIGAEAGTQFKMDAKLFTFVTGGAAALVVFLCWWLTYLSKPEVKMSVYQVYDEHNKPMDLNWAGAIEFPSSPGGAVVNAYVRGPEVVLIYPEQLAEQEIRVRKTSGGDQFSWILPFHGVRQFKLTWGNKDTETVVPNAGGKP